MPARVIMHDVPDQPGQARIESVHSLIDHEQRRASRQRPQYANYLPLARRQIPAALAESGLEPVRKARKKLSQPALVDNLAQRAAGGGDAAAGRALVTPKHDVFRQREIEKLG